MDGVPDVAHRRASACLWMESWIMFHAMNRANVCVVFDIDDTLITAKEPVAEVVDLLLRLRSRGVAVFLVTARTLSDEFEARTRKHLEQVGVPSHLYQRLFMMPRDERAHPSMADVARFKYDCRKAIRRTHFIAGNVGDMVTDLTRLPVPRDMSGVEESRHDILLFVHPVEKCACLKLSERER